MNLLEKATWAELKFRVLEAAVMLNNDYTTEEVTAKLLEVVDVLDNNQP